MTRVEELSPAWQHAIKTGKCCPRCLMDSEHAPCLSKDCPMLPPDKNFTPPKELRRMGSFRDILDVPEEVAEELDRVFGPEESPKPEHQPPLGQDMVVLPKHYAHFEIEPIRFICTNKLDFFQANIIKYTCRAEFKHSDKGLEDCLKVIRYGVMRAKYLQGDPDWWKPYRDQNLHTLIQEEITGYGRTQDGPPRT